MSNLQGAAAVQAFIEGCLASHIFLISDEFRAYLIDVSAKLVEDPHRSDLVFNDQEIDEAFELHRLARREKQKQSDTSFLDYSKELLDMVLYADSVLDDQTFVLDNTHLDDELKKYFLKVLESVEPFYDLTVGKPKIEKSHDVARIDCFVGNLSKKDFDQLIVLVTRKLAKSIKLRDVSEDKICFYIAEKLYESSYLKDEEILKKLLPYTQVIYDMYNRCDRLNRKILLALMDIHAYKNFDEEMKELLKKHFLHQPCHGNVDNKTANQVNKDIELLLIGEECGEQRLAIWPLNNRTADIYVYRRVEHLVWPDQLYQQIQKSAPERTEAWLALWQHAATAKALKKPSPKWLKTAQQHVIPIQAEFSQQLIEWVRFILRNSSEYWYPFSIQNEPVIKGLIWFFLYVEHAEKATVLGEVVRFGYAILCRDPRTRVVAEAALYVIGEMGMAGVLQLSLLRRKATERKAKKPIEKMLYATATKLGMSVADLEDLAVPELEGFVDGEIVYRVGDDYHTIIRVESVQQVDVVWKNQDKILTHAPKMANRYSRTMSELNQEYTVLSDMLVTQSQRLEDSILQGRTWTYDGWQNQLVSHRVLNWLAQRLIWQFETDGQLQHGFYTDGQWCDVAGQPLSDLNEQTIVRVWQPIFSTTEEVLAWRQLMTNRQIVQPFRQAFLAV